MLELGKYSKKLHIEVAKNVNNSNINEVYVYGKKLFIHLTKLDHKKRKNIKFKKDIIDFLTNDIKNGNTDD